MELFTFQVGVLCRPELPHAYECLCPECKWNYTEASLENRTRTLIGFTPQIHQPWNDTVIVGKGVIECPHCHTRFWIYLTRRLATTIYRWKAWHQNLYEFIIEQFVGRLSLDGGLNNVRIYQSKSTGEEKFTVVKNKRDYVRFFELRRVVEMYYVLRGHIVKSYNPMDFGFQYKIVRQDEGPLLVSIVTRAFRAIEIFVCPEKLRSRIATTQLQS